MSATRTEARMLEHANRAALDHAWNNPEPSFDPHGDQRWRAAEDASRHLASLSPERRAEMNAGWVS